MCGFVDTQTSIEMDQSIKVREQNYENKIRDSKSQSYSKSKSDSTPSLCLFSPSLRFGFFSSTKELERLKRSFTEWTREKINGKPPTEVNLKTVEQVRYDLSFNFFPKLGEVFILFDTIKFCWTLDLKTTLSYYDWSAGLYELNKLIELISTILVYIEYWNHNVSLIYCGEYLVILYD